MNPDTKLGLKAVGAIFGIALYLQVCSNLWKATDDIALHTLLGIGSVVIPIAVWWTLKKLQNTQLSSANASAGKQVSLSEAHRDIISRYYNQISVGTYIENLVRDCLGEIAVSEGRFDLTPRYRESLHNYKERTDLPAEYRHLADHLENSFD
jgi:hypothetical protein